jgi:hypothetical protein
MYIVSDKAIKRTTECTKNFSCLSRDPIYLCEIESHPSQSVYFIKRLNDMTCNYSYSFGDLYCCTCPVRQEIYKSYNI